MDSISSPTIDTIPETVVGFPDLRDDDMLHATCCDNNRVTLCKFECEPVDIDGNIAYSLECVVCTDLCTHPTYCPIQERCTYSG